MKKLDRPSPDAEPSLRQRAEAAYQAKGATAKGALGKPSSPEAAQLVIHELRVHQIELEMQAEELRRAQLELEASRGRYFDLYDLAPNGYCTISGEGLIQEANLTLATMLGVPRVSLLKQAFSRYLLKEDAGRFYAFHHELIKTGSSKSAELRLLRPDHDPRWVQVTATTILDDHGAPVIHFALADISELKLANRNLLEENQERIKAQHLSHEFLARLQIATRAGRIGIWDWNVVDNTQLWDDTICDIYGVPHEGFTGGVTQWSDHLHPDDRVRVDHDLQAALRGEREYAPEFRVIRPDGSIRHVKANSQTFFDANGKPLRMVGTNIDITGIKQAEEKLRELGQIIEQAPLSVVITDLTGKIEYVNPRFCAVTGYMFAEAIGLNPRVLKSGETPPETYRDLWQTISGGTVWTGTLINRKKNGEIYHEIATIAPVVDNNGHRTHYVALKDDLTVPKRLADEAAAKLEHQRLLLEMKSRFISVTSHEFRTPMSAAMGSVEILTHHLDQLAPAKRIELLTRITSSLQHMTTMLDEILMLNRMDADRVEVKPVPVDLTRFLQDLIEETRLGDREAHSLVLLTREAPAPFITDPTLLRQILSNLISNAVRYSPVGTVVTLRVELDAKRALVAVEDQGIGVPEADRVRIFEPFERGSNVGPVKGSGLGLSIVKRMTELLGGTIAYEVPPGGGSCFTLTLPVTSANPPSA